MSDSRKEAIRKFKEQKVPRGIFAVKCTTSGNAWVGASRNLAATQNGTWFGLRSGGYIDKSLQEEWNRHGEASFQYEILEQLDGDLLPMAVADLLKERRAHWIAELNARLLN